MPATVQVAWFFRISCVDPSAEDKGMPANGQCRQNGDERGNSIEKWLKFIAMISHISLMTLAITPL